MLPIYASFLVAIMITLSTAQDSVVPSWFYTDYQICYNYYADGDSGQCNSGNYWTGETCAKPNSFTADYRDDTDKRPGGCQMQWRLTAPYRPEALALSVAKLCFKYRAEGDVGQCGDHAREKVTCVPVNDYTPFYRDDSDGRPGACQMSWMIQVPAGVPIPAWMNKVRLCMNWRADGDAQCSGPVSPVCARINEWTGEYRDDSDERAGGCQMSWGLKVE